MSSSDDKPRAYSIQNNFTQDTERNETLIPLNIEDIDELLEEGIEEFEMDKISAFRLEKDRKERKRIREQYKVTFLKKNFFLIYCKNRIPVLYSLVYPARVELK